MLVIQGGVFILWFEWVLDKVRVVASGCWADGGGDPNSTAIAI